MEVDFEPFTLNNRVSVDLKTVFRVYYMEAPLSFLGKKLGLGLGPNLVELHGYHTGVAFQSTDPQRPLEFYLDLISVGLSFYTLFPRIVTTPNGTEALVWNNHSTVTIGRDINRNYWEKSNFVCTITGKDLIDIQNFVLSEYIPMNPRYIYNNITIGLSRESLFNPVARSSTCNDFAAAIFEYIQNDLKVCIDLLTPNFETIFSIVASTAKNIQIVDYNNPETRKDIIRYYSLIEKLVQEKIPGGFADFTNSLINEINQTLTGTDGELTPDGLSALKSIQTDRFSINYLLSQVIKDFPYIYTYGYGPDGVSLVYYKVIPQTIYINYIESDLKRNVVAMNTSGEPVRDDYTLDPGHIDHGFLGCNSPVDGVSNCYSLSSSTISIVFACVALLLLIIILMVWVIRQLRTK